MSRQDLPTEPKRADESLGELFGSFTRDLTSLMHKEIELAKLEAKDEVKKAGTGVGMMGGAGATGYLALIMFSFALAWLLDQAMNTALAFAIVGVLWAIVAAVLLSKGRAKVKSMRGLPETTRTIKEDIQWAKTQKS
jgi:hypothetical protein